MVSFEGILCNKQVVGILGNLLFALTCLLFSTTITGQSPGYLMEEMQEAAKEVESIKLVGKESDFRQYTAKIFFAFSLVAMIASWAVVHYVFD